MEREVEGGGEPLKGSMGGNVPMAPLKPDHVLKGDVFGSSKKKLVLMLPHCPYQSTPSIFKQRLKKTLKWEETSCFGYLTVRLHTLLKVQDQKPTPF